MEEYENYTAVIEPSSVLFHFPLMIFVIPQLLAQLANYGSLISFKIDRISDS